MLKEKNKAITCCFMGHDIILKKDITELYNITMDFFIKLYNKGYRYFIINEFFGYSFIAATVVIDAKVHLPDIKIILILESKNTF